MESIKDNFFTQLGQAKTFLKNIVNNKNKIKTFITIYFIVLILAYIILIKKFIRLIMIL